MYYNNFNVVHSIFIAISLFSILYSISYLVDDDNDDDDDDERSCQLVLIACDGHEGPGGIACINM
jgi:hypothetical protein